VAPPTSAILHRDTRFIPKKAIGGKGSYIFLEDGQKVLDSTGGAAVSCLGHGNEKVKNAVIKQIDELSYCHSAFFGTQAAEDLARLLVDSTGGKLSKLYVACSGLYSLSFLLKYELTSKRLRSGRSSPKTFPPILPRTPHSPTPTYTIHFPASIISWDYTWCPRCRRSPRQT